MVSCSDSKQAYSDYYAIASSFGNYSSINWAHIDSLYYRPYNCDWGDDLDELITKSQFPIEKAAEYWHLLKNAKTNFKEQCLPIREVAPKRLRKRIDYTASLFDTVFVRIIEQEYYMRIFPDVYNEIIGEYIY